VDVLGVPVEQAVYTREEIGDQVVVSSGGRILFNYTAGDQAMRNFAVVALANTRMKIRNVATLFDITPEYVYTLRKHAAEQGSAGLFPTRGRPPALTPSQAERARRWAAEGMPKPEIAERLKVHRSTIYRLLGAGEAPPATATQPALEFTPDEPETETAARPDTETPDPRETPEQPDTGTETAEAPAAPQDQPEQPAAPLPAKTTAAPAPAEPRATAPETPPAPGPAIYSRYAGATLLHAFFDRVGLAGICAGTDILTNPTRSYPDLTVLTATTIAFALGAPTVVI
jgi:transposase